MKIGVFVGSLVMWGVLVTAGSTQEKPAPAAKKTSAQEEAQPQPGEWALVFELENHIFPSAVITLSTIKPEELGIKPDEDSFGSPLGMASVRICSKAAGDKVAVEISSTKLIRPSRLEVTLPKAGTVYELRPQLLYEYEKMLAVRQPYPEDVTAKVTLNGQPLGEKTQTVVVCPINDCLFGVVEDDGYDDWSELFAAYVNENHPVVEDILGEALRKGYVDSFSGYQGSEDDVTAELTAIWQVLKERGVKYCDISTTAAESATVQSQHVRLVGESIEGAQANCVDGSVLMASVFRKLGLDAYLVLLPSHMMVAVALDKKGDNIVAIETTALAFATLEQAVDSAQETVEKYKGKDKEGQMHFISINEARAAGIMPLREVSK